MKPEALPETPPETPLEPLSDPRSPQPAPAKVRKSEPRRRSREAGGLRTGYTTGACSAAAARAAVLGLLTGEVPALVDCQLPNGQTVAFAVTGAQVSGQGVGRRAVAEVVKDAGDDPDATHGAHLVAEVCLLPHRAGSIELLGGVGVGVVTRPGLGLEVGGPAINPVPRRNIRDNVRAVAGELLDADGLAITLSVPDGEERARKTLNARLGILGGISILGTTGIVRPYSTAAFRASVVQAITVAARQGQRHVVFTTGGRTEKFAMGQLPHLDVACFVQMGDFVKAAFTTAIREGMTRITVGAMVGKLTKMAQGLAVTHAWKESIDRQLLADCAREVGAPAALVAEIGAAETARFAAEALAGLGLSLPFHRALAARALATLRSAYPGPYRLDVQVCDFEGQPIVGLAEE